MAGSAGNITNLGPCNVTFNSTDLGYVSNVEVTKDEKVHEAKVESFGDAPVAAWKGGVNVQVKFVLNESLLASMALVSAHEAVITGTTSTGTKIAAGGVVGAAVTSGLLKCSPVGKTNQDFAVYKAFVASHPKKIAMQAEKAAEYEVVFRGMIDDSRASGDQLYSYGNTTAKVA